MSNSSKKIYVLYSFCAHVWWLDSAKWNKQTTILPLSNIKGFEKKKDFNQIDKTKMKEQQKNEMHR